MSAFDAGKVHDPGTRSEMSRLPCERCLRAQSKATDFGRRCNIEEAEFLIEDRKTSRIGALK
jgi:hypothetical protein